MLFRPVGTMEESLRNAQFVRPSGTQTTIVVHVPSSELLGYYQASLRDGVRRMHLGAKARTLKALQGDRPLCLRGFVRVFFAHSQTGIAHGGTKARRGGTRPVDLGPQEGKDGQAVHGTL